tara:strand:+ start:144 stop:545 length:402 start_codon:yes stop_codon:yes gene_type:complete
MAFKLRSGNTTPFKKMGSSPVKQDKKKATMEGIAEGATTVLAHEGGLKKEGLTKPVVNLPKEIKSDLAKQTPRKDTLKGRTGFEADVLDPIRSASNKVWHKLTGADKFTPTMVNTKEKLKKSVKKVKDYFTKR